MKFNLIDILVCPECKESLTLEVLEEEAGQVKTGVLTCNRNGCKYPIEKYVPRFVDADRYADSFSKQRLYIRRHFKYYQNDKSGEDLFLPTTGFDPGKLKNGISLEVGCGYGRFLNVVNKTIGGRIVGIDLSTHSVDLAQDYVGHRENVDIVQCDLFKLPFQSEQFSHIFSIGVLHHTPEPKKAFHALVPYLKKEGQISIWLYPPQMKKSSNRWRNLTTKLPHAIVYWWCILNQLLFSWIRALPGGWRINAIVPGCVPAPGRSFWLRVMSDFDDLTPKYASVHTNEETELWFKEAGLKDVRSLARATSVSGTR